MSSFGTFIIYAYITGLTRDGKATMKRMAVTRMTGVTLQEAHELTAKHSAAIGPARGEFSYNWQEDAIDLGTDY